MATFAVKSIDHVVLTVKSIEATVNFYTSRLGMKHEVFTSKGVERCVVPQTICQHPTDVECNVATHSHSGPKS